MQKLFFSVALCATLAFAPLRVAYSAEDDLSTFTLKQLDTAISNSDAAAQELDSILSFHNMGEANIAILSSSRAGWSITVFHRVPGGIKVGWRSGALTNDFSVVSLDGLEIENVDGETVLEFSGCAAHECAGADGIFGVLLYSPRSKQAFFAHYRFDEHKPIGSFGSLQFSENANEPGHERYKVALREAMNKALRL
jgi:hypothetical protein